MATRILISLAIIFLLHHSAGGHVEQARGEFLGLDPRLGQYIPLDLTFNDEAGHPVTLKQLIHTPTVLALVYLHCPNVCSLLLQNLADTLNRLPAEPGKD